MNNYPRTAKEISKIFHLDASSATRGCKNVQLITSRLEKDLGSEEKTVLHKTTPICFVERYCSKLKMKSEEINLCKFMCMKIEKHDYMPSNTPHSIATGVIYFVGQFCNLQFTKLDLRSVSGISEVTINQCYKTILSFKDVLVPPLILSKYNKN